MRIGLGMQVRTFADVSEPDVPQGASALAVDTFQLFWTDDDVGEGSSVLEDENGTVATRVIVCVAGTTTVVLSVAEVSTTADGHRRREGDYAARAGWNVESLSRCEASEGEEGGGLHDFVCFADSSLLLLLLAIVRIVLAAPPGDGSSYLSSPPSRTHRGHCFCDGDDSTEELLCIAKQLYSGRRVCPSMKLLSASHMAVSKPCQCRCRCGDAVRRGPS